MTAGLNQLREENCSRREKRPHDYGMANSVARKLRREHPSGTIDAAAALFGLTNGEARGAVYGTASRATLDKILKRGGWALAVELLADLLGQPLEHFIADQAERARHERKRWEEEERAAQVRLADLSDLDSRPWRGPDAPR
jgi:hypothetical protein